MSNDDFSLTTTVGLAVCLLAMASALFTTTVGTAICLLAAIIFSLQTQSLSQSALGSIVWIRSYYLIDGFLLGYFLGQARVTVSRSFLSQTNGDIWRSTFSTFERERYLQFLEIEITNSFANWGHYFGLVSGILEVWCSGSKYSSNMRSIFMTAIVGKKKRL